jgi:hypothetical protein
MPMGLGIEDAKFAYLSTMHWKPILNGYSGYYPPIYDDLLRVIAKFPDGDSLARLRDLKIDHVLVHEHLYAPKEYVALMLRVVEHHDLVQIGRFSDGEGETRVLEIRSE